MSTNPSHDLPLGARPALSTGGRTVLAAAVLMLALQISPWYYSHGDGHAYISIARHLARGDGLRKMESPVLWFPPGYPMLISPLFFLRDLPLLEISIVQFLLAAGLAWGIYCWARPRAAEGAVWIAALTVGTNAVWIQYRRPISEIAFMAVMAWLLVSLDRLARPWSRGRWLAWLVAAAGLASAASLVRSVGIALAAGGSCSLLAAALRRTGGPRRPNANALSWRAALCAGLLIGGAAAITEAAVALRDRRVAEPLGAETYLNTHSSKRGAEALADYGPWFALAVSDIGRITVPFMFKCYGEIGAWWDVNMLVYVPVFCLLFFGYIRWIRNSDDPLAWSLPFYLAVLTCFRYESGARHWVPMTPALFMCLWFALERCGRRLQIMRVVWLLHVAAALAYWLGSDLPHTRAVNQDWPAVRSLAGEITSDREQVVIDASRADFGLLLTLALDRRVNEFSADESVPASARWLVLPIGQKPPPGFLSRANAGGCALWKRE
jgi:hypothetical protein